MEPEIASVSVGSSEGGIIRNGWSSLARNLRRSALLLVLAAVTSGEAIAESRRRTSSVPRPQAARQQLETHRLLSAKEAAAAGVQLRRTFIFGWPGPLGVIVAQRLPGEQPTLSFRRAGGRGANTIRTPISEATWRSIVARTPRGNGSKRPRPQDGEELCVEHWQFHLESVDAGKGREPQVGRWSGGACSDPEAMAYTLWLAETAARLIEPCVRLSAASADAIGRLSTCSILRGNLESAVQVAGLLQALEDLGVVTNESEDDVLDANVVLRWLGKAFRGPPAVRAVWQTIRADPLFSGIEFDAVRGIDRDRVEVTGRLAYLNKAGAPAHERDMSALWVRDAGAFRLLSISTFNVRPRAGHRSPLSTD